ncbi:MAG TPA: hypothetical protein EYP43_02120 [Thermoplasmata archaeon]|nr:hypothetical protein [Thermoplasmata archaeon]
MTLKEHRYLPYELAIVAIAALLIIAYLNPPESTREKVPRATIGDTVVVWYIGRFEDGSVFDTNMFEVNDDDVMWPKSPGYQKKPDDEIKPLKFVVGSGNLLRDFELAVIGLKKGDRTTVTIPPERGYGLSDESLIVTADLRQSVPLYEHMSLDEFNDTYGHTYDRSLDRPPLNITFPHHIYGWNVTLIAIADDFEVTLFNAPEIGALDVFPWNTTVLDIESGANGTILVEHHPQVGDRLDGVYEETDPFGMDLGEGKSTGTVTDVGVDTFTIDYNREVVGKTLIFEIEMILVERG